MHGECLLREQDSVGNTEERKSGCGLVILQIGHSLLFKLTKVLKNVSGSIINTSLVHHTPQSQGKRGLVTMLTRSCSGDQILSRPIRFKIFNLLLSNVLLSARALIAGHVIFVVIHDTFCNYCIPREQLAVCKVTRPLFPCD